MAFPVENPVVISLLLLRVAYAEEPFRVGGLSCGEDVGGLFYRGVDVAALYRGVSVAETIRVAYVAAFFPVHVGEPSRAVEDIFLPPFHSIHAVGPLHAEITVPAAATSSSVSFP